MIVQFVLLHVLRMAMAIFESIRYWCDAVLVPFCYYLTKPNTDQSQSQIQNQNQKAPQHIAVIVSRDRFVEATAAALHEFRLSNYTLIIDDPKAIANKQLSNHIYVKGSYPLNMLKDAQSAPKEYDLVVSFQDRLDLSGVDARCVGFATFAVVPCVCSFFVRMQLVRALAVFGESRQNYGK